jgi:phage terminase large subunit-like protein
MDFAGRWIAMIARTPADARDYMIEGPGGIMKNVPKKEQPVYEVSKRRLTWPNGSWATIYSSEEPDQLRGFSGDTAWLDEFLKFNAPQEVWDNLAFGMREASTDKPRKVITSTPRPLPVLTAIEKMSSTVVVVGSSYENRSNLDPDWFSETLSRYEGTRLGRQEIAAEILSDLPGALWTRDLLEKSRVDKDKSLPDFKRVVVGVDPSGTSGSEDERANSVGIVCVALGVDNICYVLSDRTCSLSPDGWGRRVVEAHHYYEGDRIVAERNFGGAMVDHVIRTVDKNVPVRLVHASRGKTARAEPVAALYEQGKVKHVGGFPELEDQLCQFLPEEYVGGDSPDRADALVWAVHELALSRFSRDPRPMGLPQFREGHG